MKPLENLIVLEFCQYMAGPSAGLRLADLGARVIKIERPETGEGGRRISIKNLFAGDDSIVFHTINRNKESYTADFKDEKDLARIKRLIKKADVLTHNFRPGTMEKFGLDYKTIHSLNPRLIYGIITGYGNRGPWANKPGQDLLIQAMSGLTHLSGNADDPPVAFGLSVADMLSGAHLVQGILAALIKRGKTDRGSLVEVSLLESTIDLQFEVITTYLNDGGKLPLRAEQGSAHAYLSAPYGIYETEDGFIVLAMGDLHTLGKQMDLDEFLQYDKEEWFSERDEIMQKLRKAFKKKATNKWLDILEPASIWCAGVHNYQEFLSHEAYKALQMNQKLELHNGDQLITTRCPIRIDGHRIFNNTPAPSLGKHTESIDREFDL